jgi:hypothetical protein
MIRRVFRRPRRLLLILLLPLLAGVAGWSAVRPSHARVWVAEHARLPRAEIDGSRVRIHDVRDFRYDAAGAPIPAYDVRDYDLDRIASVWFVLTPFDREWRGPAHAFLSFGFADSQYIAVSVEARREAGERYSMVGGALKRYELAYILGDERDLIGNRALVQNDDVYVYPVRATPAQARALFEDILSRVNALHAAPEFYGTLLNNCTTAILSHVNRIASKPIRWGPRILLPGYSDALALELGLLDTELSLTDSRRAFHINDRARAHADAFDFSRRIRDRETSGLAQSRRGATRAVSS